MKLRVHSEMHTAQMRFTLVQSVVRRLQFALVQSVIEYLARRARWARGTSALLGISKTPEQSHSCSLEPHKCSWSTS